MTGTTWSNVSKGDRITLAGADYEVTKIKPKGKKIKVTIVGKRGTFSHEVKAKDAVVIAPLHDSRGAQKRWATKAEAKAGPERKKPMLPEQSVIPAGDPTILEAPAKATGGLWDTPATKVEKKLDTILGAHLVGESKDETAGYYVPPVDVSTIAAHMMLFHGGSEYAEHDESRLMAMHEQQHKMFLDGDARPKVNHWHTKERP